MDALKKILGVLFIALGVFAAYYMATTLVGPKLATGKPEDKIVAIIYMFLMPIVGLSLVVFGYYGVTGEYSDEKA